MGFPRGQHQARCGTRIFFFPEKDRTRHWVEARGEYTVSQWPALVRPGWLQNVVSTSPIVVAIATGFAASVYLRSPVSLSLVLAGCSALAAWYSLRTLTRSQCKSFPGMSTIRDLASHLPIGGFNGLLRRDENPSRAEIAAIVKQIVIEQLGIKESDYGENREFIRDFGMG